MTKNQLINEISEQIMLNPNNRSMEFIVKVFVEETINHLEIKNLLKDYQ